MQELQSSLHRQDQEEAERLNYLADQLIATGKELKETTYDAVLKGIRP